MHLGSKECFTRAAAMLRRKRSELAAWLGRAADNGEGTTMAIENKPDEDRLRMVAIQKAVLELQIACEKAFTLGSLRGRIAQLKVNSVQRELFELAD